jgi:hypothetical protein
MFKWSVHFLGVVLPVLFYGCEFSDYRELLVSGGIFAIYVLGLVVFIVLIVNSIKNKQWKNRITGESFSFPTPTINYDKIYKIGFFITAIIVFIACWIYAIVSWGFLIGVGLGWIPSLFIAVIAGFIWPLLALVLVGGLCIIGFLIKKGN